MKAHLAAIVLAAVLAAVSSAASAGNMLFIFDASNSMWGQVDGVAKLETAKSVLTKLVTDLPAGTSIGLMAYGHRSEGDCKDVEMLSSIGGNAADVAARVQALTAKGKTPIAHALSESAAAFTGIEEEANSIVLISDGIESCDGDPCAVAGDLIERGINVRVHVVGFDVDAEARAQLECIAQKGNGKYFSAEDAEGLRRAAEEVVEVAENETPAPAPTPAVVEPKEVFFDDFEGTALAEHWEIVNPNPDAYIVEDGTLLILSGKAASLAKDDVENLFRLTTPLPDGDWTMSAKLRVDYQTLREVPFIGLHSDKGTWLIGGVIVEDYCCEYSRFFASSWKSAGGEVTTFKQDIIDGPGPNEGVSAWAEALSPHYFKMVKQGRSYTFFVKLGDSEEAKWVELPELTSLRPSGNLALGLMQSEAKGGESIIYVDWIKLEVPG